VALPLSRVDGKAVRFATNRQYLGRACQLGFTNFAALGPDRPVVCRDGTRLFLWMTLPAKEVLPPHPFPVRVSLDSAPPRPVAGVRAGGFPARQATVRPRTPSDRAAAEEAGVLSLRPLASRLAGLVRDQRRRERGEGV
jgi:hypothetical protein